jgi:hypothetical protein
MEQGLGVVYLGEQKDEGVCNRFRSVQQGISSRFERKGLRLSGTEGQSHWAFDYS